MPDPKNSDPKYPEIGAQHIDASDMALKIISPEFMSDLSKLHEGYEKGVANLIQASAEALKRAGINPDEVEKVRQFWADFQRLDLLIPAHEQLGKMFIGTRMLLGHEIALRLGEAARLARGRGERDLQGFDIAGSFADLLAYHFGPAQKAADTREKNKKEEEEMKAKEVVSRQEKAKAAASKRKASSKKAASKETADTAEEKPPEKVA
jgi:hypothetical protein